MGGASCPGTLASGAANKGMTLATYAAAQCNAVASCVAFNVDVRAGGVGCQFTSATSAPDNQGTYTHNWGQCKKQAPTKQPTKVHPRSSPLCLSFTPLTFPVTLSRRLHSLLPQVTFVAREHDITQGGPGAPAPVIRIGAAIMLGRPWEPSPRSAPHNSPARALTSIQMGASGACSLG